MNLYNIKSAIGRRMVRFKYSGNGLTQDLIGGGTGEDLVVPEVASVSREAAAAGIVLLKNDGVLPLNNEQEVAVYGRCAIDYFCVGYGSGGDIRYPYKVNLMEALNKRGAAYNPVVAQLYSEWVKKPMNRADEGYWGHWPTYFEEMPLRDIDVDNAAAESDAAIIVIGRAAGEERENSLTAGSYYLTKREKKMLDVVTKHFKKVIVVLDWGNLCDLSWLEDYGNSISAVVLAWQGGMESGNGLCDVLYGDYNPSAKLTDTIAYKYEDYPSSKNFGRKNYNNYYEDIFVGYRYFETFDRDAVMYPFGFGLSYTRFSKKAEITSRGTGVKVSIEVKNTGRKKGKEVVFAYVDAPLGVLGTPSRVLAAFGKTKELAPGESETITLKFDLKDIASFDDKGITGHKDCFVLDAGEYGISVGGSIREAVNCGTVELKKLISVSEPSDALGIENENSFKRLTNHMGKKAESTVPWQEESLKDRILENLPEETEYTGDLGYKLEDVVSGKCTLDEFVAQLTKEEMDDIIRGYGPMNCPMGTEGNAGAFGGINDGLIEKGIATVITADGPSGIRLKKTCSLNPCGTALASSFDTDLVERMYEAIGQEMNYYNIDVLLAPGMNIHRNPLCGRNFEYYSEDPLVAGKIASSVIRGLRRAGVEGCPKHMIANNQEVARNSCDSRVSKRALRELYLKNFEIVVKEAKPKVLMASYNKINGQWSHYNYDLFTTILRKEWGYEGVVITDWWMHAGASKDFPDITNDAYRIRSQVDVMMPGCDGYLPFMIVGRTLYDTLGQPEGITLGEVQRSVKNILKAVIDIKLSR